MMPEGPEVLTMAERNQLELSRSSDWSLTQMKIVSGRYLKESPAGFQKAIEILPSKFKHVKTKGKFTYFSFEHFTLQATLGLTGWWTFDANGSGRYGEEMRNMRMQFVFHSPELDQTKFLSYYDDLSYGTVKISFDSLELEKKLNDLGVCWLTEHPSFEQFYSIVQSIKPTTNVAVFLMNQKKTAGIGNYILSEVLYLAGIHPWATIGALSLTDWKQLYDAICHVFTASYRSQSPLYQLSTAMSSPSDASNALPS